MLDLFTASGTSPTSDTVALLFLLFVDVVAWFGLVKFLQRVTGRQQPHLPPPPRRWTEVPAVPGRAVVIVGGRPAIVRKPESATRAHAAPGCRTFLLPIGPTDANGNTPVLDITLYPNGDTVAERGIWRGGTPR